MNTVELLPAIRFDCQLCSNQSWHNCTMRTGMEAFQAFMEDMMQSKAVEHFVQKIRQRALELDHRVPAIPDFKSAVLIKANKIGCKTCQSGVGSINRGFTYICDECGRNNYFLPENDSVSHVECEHCGNKFRAEHFMQGVMQHARRREGAG